MPKKAPHKFLAPIIIAGITAGFLASACKFIFAMKKRAEAAPDEMLMKNSEKENEKSV